MLPARVEPVVGRPVIWARDFGLMGGLSSLGFWLLAAPALMVDFIILGTVTAAFLGAGLAIVFERVRGRVPLSAISVGALAACSLWGFSTLALGGVPALAALGFGGLMGLMVFGWWWFAYTVTSVIRAHRWPLLLVAVPWGVTAWMLMTGLLGLF